MVSLRFDHALHRVVICYGIVLDVSFLAGLVYVLIWPGPIELHCIWLPLLAWFCYATTLTASLLLRRRWARLIYFAFPVILAWEETLNFAPIDQIYALSQLEFSLFLASWFCCLDVLVGEWIARKFPNLAGISTVLLGMGLYLLPAIILVYQFCIGGKFTYDSIQAVYQTELSEVIGYTLDHPIGIILILVLVLFAVTIFFLNRIGERRAAPVGVLLTAGITFLALAPWGWLELVDSEALNRTKVLFTDSLEYFRVIEAYNEDGVKRLALVEQMVELPSGDDGVYVLIIGESHNRRHCSAYGYQFETTPFFSRATSDPDCILMQNAYSCHVQTVPVLSMMLTSWNQYAKSAEPPYPSIFDVANYCSYDTVFLSNQYPHGRFDSPVAALTSSAQKMIWLNTMEDFILWRARSDGALLEPLPELLQSDRRLLVVHMMGSHGPYFRRYPKDFHPELKWYPYDKSVLYTDTLLEQMVELFRSNPRVKAAIYVADHSEKPGVGHGADVYEPEMSEIPMLLYLSEELRSSRPELERSLRENATHTFTNDLVFELLLDVMNVRHRFTPASLRLSGSDYALKREDARTLWGTHPLDTPRK